MEVIINRCFGGYGLSHDAVMEYAKQKGMELFAYVNDMNGWNFNSKDKYLPFTGGANAICIHYCTKKLKDEFDKETLNKYYFSPDSIERTDPILIKIVRKMGKKANGYCADLKIVKIPDGTDYEIEEYDGNEHIAEKHRTWG